MSKSRTLAWDLKKARHDYLHRMAGVPLTFKRAERDDLLAKSETSGLREVSTSLSRTAPRDLRPFVREVLMVSPPNEHEIVAYARSLGTQSRLVVISRSYSLLGNVRHSAG